MMSALSDSVVRFFREESGQDLVEYAILTTIVTVGGLTLFSTIKTKMGTAYTTWGTAILNNWSPPDPLPIVEP